MTTKTIDWNIKKRYAIISDIHGNIEGLNSILDDIKKRDVDEIFCLWDTIDIGPNSKECVDRLIDMGIESILWNHELYLTRGTDIEPSIIWEEKKLYEWVKNQLWEKEIDYIENCPLYYELNIKYNNIPDKKIILTHYLIKDENLPQPFESTHLKRDINLLKKYNDENIIYVIGHLHNDFDINEIEWIESIKKPINIKIVGSAGCSKDNYVSYTIIEIWEEINFENIKVEFDRNTFINKINSLDFPDKDNIKKLFYWI